LTEAVRFALEAHAGQTRKGTRIPYASHLLQVAGLVLEHGGDPVQAIAAVLHDTVEDCEAVEVETLRRRFGVAVAEIVETCSDVLPGDRPDAKSPWIERKRRYVERLRGADARTRLVAACDKLHNLRCIVADLRTLGPASLERFTGSAEQTRGYYEAARDALAPGLPDPLVTELDALLAELCRFVPRSAWSSAAGGRARSEA
jgi:(p)ppGpp synthase/HD superfamily hydrolase